MSATSNVAKRFNTILEDIKNNKSTTKPRSVKSRCSNINLHPLQCSKKIMDMIKHLIFLIKLTISVMNFISINVGFLIRLVQKMKFWSI